MKADSQKYELPVSGSAWTKSVELGAGIFFLAGRTHVAGHSSAAEGELLARGAMLIATLRFRPDPLEASHPERAVRALGTGAAVNRFGGAPSRN
ncbi:hypothetical protein BH23GEM3_BH23GEM3_09250 [soil metagenome]